MPVPQGMKTKVITINMIEAVTIVLWVCGLALLAVDAIVVGVAARAWFDLGLALVISGSVATVACMLARLEHIVQEAFEYGRTLGKKEQEAKSQQRKNHLSSAD